MVHSWSVREVSLSDRILEVTTILTSCVQGFSLELCEPIYLDAGIRSHCRTLGSNLWN